MNANRAVQVNCFLLRVAAGSLFFQAGGMKFLGLVRLVGGNF
jgi:hypothetical protein